MSDIKNTIKMKKHIISLLFVAITLISKAQQVDVSGFARTYEAIDVDEGDFLMMQQTLNLNFEKRGEKVAFKANPMLYYYNKDSLNLKMREIYLDMYFDNFDIRLGKQQIVWGKADGVFITDIVSPLNLSEFLLPDFDEIRTGVLAAKLDYYIGNGTLEAILIPQFTPTTRPDANSIWYRPAVFPAPAHFDWSRVEIKPSLENTEAFVKYSMMTSKVDFELMGGYTWDDNPVMHVKKMFGIDSSSMPPHPHLQSLNITPEHHRLTLTGASFSTEIKGIILRGEAAYYNGKYFQTKDPDAEDAIVRKDYLHYVAGVDFNVGNVKLSTQFIQQYIMDYEEDILNRKTENTATFMARYDMMRETLHIELFSYLGLDDKDALIRPKLSYDFEDGFSLQLGANIFVGDEEGRFGKYKDNSMIYTKIKYNF
jgi:hypothetical protein